jgi:signal transduction histidine kinase
MRHSRLTPYAVPLLGVPLALLLTLLGPQGPGSTPLFLAVVTVSTWYGGLGPGLTATAGSVLALDLFRTPAFALSSGWEARLRLATFLAAAILIGSLGARQRRLEKALRQRDRQKDELLATLAHELRSPLTAILNALHVLRPTAAETDEGTQVQALLERQVRHIARLTEDLLDLSRIGLGKLRLVRQVVDVTAAAATAVEAVRPLVEIRRHRLEKSWPAEPVFLDGDPFRLTQVIVNLLANAANYTEPGGVIRLAVEREGEEAVVRVQDSGAGLAPEMLPRVFDLYVQGENGAGGGLGLGLNLVRRLVEMHGGRVTASSQGTGRGSEFVARFPALAARAPCPSALDGAFRSGTRPITDRPGVPDGAGVQSRETRG